MEYETKSSLHDYERDLWEMEARQSSYRRFQQVFQLYAVVGALIGIGALAYFFVRRLQIDLSSLDQMILLTAGSGFALSILSGLFLLLRQQRYSAQLDRSRYMTKAADFLLQWARFETIGREKLEASGRDFNRMSIRDIISELLNSKIISSDDLVQLEEILRFRNLLVHSGSSIDAEVLGAMTETLRNLQKRIEALTASSRRDGAEGRTGQV